VETVAGLEARRAARRDRLVAAHDDVDHRLARQAEVAHARPRHRVVGRDLVLEHLGAEAADRARLRQRPGQGRLARRRAQEARERLERRPLDEGREEHGEEDDVEELRGLGDTGDDRERGQDDRHRPAQPGAREDGALGPREARPRRGQRHGDRPGDEDEDEGQDRPAHGDVVEAAGEDEQPEGDEHRDLGDPRHALVEGRDGLLRGHPDGAEDEAGQVDGEEARAVQRVGAAVGEGGDGQRRDGIQPAGGQAHAAQAPGPGESDRQPDRQPDRQLAQEEGGHVEQPVVVLLDPVDEAEHEEHGDGIVQPRLALERARQAPLQRRGAQQREDGRAVGGREHAAEEQPVERGDVEERGGRQPGDERGDDRPEDREAERRAQHRADLAKARGQAALEEDQRQRDDPDPPGQLDVAEVDPTEAVRADGHAQEEEEQ
jgi:hypothetical protein